MPRFERIAGGQYAKPLHAGRREEVLHQTTLGVARPKPDIIRAIPNCNWQYFSPVAILTGKIDGRMFRDD